MQNILLRHCRETSKLKPAAVAASIGVAITRYRSVERASELIKWEEAVALGKLFNIKPAYIYQYSLQLENLKTCKELVNMYKQKI
jgi:DNA-binding XRE family transcriptional regulator